MTNKIANLARSKLLADLDSSLIPVSAGNILLKDESKNTFWKVETAAFFIGRHPVTEALYRAVIDTHATESDPLVPMVDVSWFDAITFCNRLSALSGLDPCYWLDGESVAWHQDADGYRLPTEAEWEYACRAGSTGVRYGELDNIAWHAANAGNRPHRVGEKEANSFGLYDMIGNVWEWCWDRYDAEVYGDYRVFRGGGWLDAPPCMPRLMPAQKPSDLPHR